MFDYKISSFHSSSSYGLFEIDQQVPIGKIIVHRFVMPSLSKYLITISFFKSLTTAAAAAAAAACSSS